MSGDLSPQAELWAKALRPGPTLSWCHQTLRHTVHPVPFYSEHRILYYNPQRKVLLSSFYSWETEVQHEGTCPELCVSNPRAPGLTKAQLSPKQGPPGRGEPAPEVLQGSGAGGEAEEMLEYLSSWLFFNVLFVFVFIICTIFCLLKMHYWKECMI